MTTIKVVDEFLMVTGLFLYKFFSLENLDFFLFSSKRDQNGNDDKTLFRLNAKKS